MDTDKTSHIGGYRSGDLLEYEVITRFGGVLPKAKSYILKESFLCMILRVDNNYQKYNIQWIGKRPHWALSSTANFMFYEIDSKMNLLCEPKSSTL